MYFGTTKKQTLDKVTELRRNIKEVGFRLEKEELLN